MDSLFFAASGGAPGFCICQEEIIKDIVQMNLRVGAFECTQDAPGLAPSVRQFLHVFPISKYSDKITDKALIVAGLAA